MEPNFDLDINNYTANDLLSFFKLDNTFSLDDLENNEGKIINEITRDNSNYTSKYKFDILNFIKSAKKMLISIKNDIETSNVINKNISNKISSALNAGYDNKVGEIINPLDVHQAIEKNNNPPDNINGYSYNTTTTVYVFNTAARNDFFSTFPSYSTYDLPVVWSNVIEVVLASANIPNVMYSFNNDFGTNQIYIEEDNTGLSGIVTLPEGNYVPYSVIGVIPATESSFIDSLTIAINTQLGTGNRFVVSFNPTDYKMTISNTTNTFSINTIQKDPSNLCGKHSHIYNNNYQDTDINNKSTIDRITYIETMSYLMGYREIFYSGQSSYTCESIFLNIYSDYLYLIFEDYTGSQTTSNTVGILGNGVLSQGILGIIPLVSSVNSTTFDSGANFIYKRREYFGPVTISRVSVKIINQKGDLVDFRGVDFSFALQVKTIYNLTKKFNTNLRNAGIF
jgi:hypothetical protein